MIAALLFLACSSAPPDPSTAPAVPSPEPAADEAEAEAPPIEHALPTTKGHRAREALDGRITTARRLLPQRPQTLPVLMADLAVRSSLFGQVSDLHEMMTLAKGTPSEGKALMAVHRFEEALAADPSLADSVNLALHRDLDALAATRRAAVEERASTDTWTALADVLLAQGKAAEADRAYANALAAYRDVSPLTVADLQFRRGLAWGESGEDPARARALYERATERLPDFVRAHVHLAEIEFEAGDKTAAIDRVRRVAHSEDPEPGGKLAQWLPEPEATEWRERTTAAYDKLLAQYPLAFANHAAEYFRAIGERDRARELAELDLANRDTPRARELCAELGCKPPE